MTEIDGWVTSEVAQDITGLSRTTLYIYRVSNKVRWQKFGRAIMYWREDLERIAKEERRNKKAPDID